uniref:MutS protein-4-like protein n=1 Tax=Aegilops tauschii TaxID=37682 RepID=N1QSN2_AEGTA
MEEGAAGGGGGGGGGGVTIAGDRSSFVIGLIENRAKEVGVAAFDLRSASLHLSQYIETSCSYQNTKTLLHFYDPNTVIVPPNKTAADGMVGVSELVDKNYQASKKKERIIAFYSKKSSLCRSQWHVVALMIPRIESEKGVIITNHSLSVTFNGSFDHMNIDSTSVQTLEIIDPLHTELWGTSNKKKSLFQMLKTTKTTGGSRLLRANLLQPLKDIQTINTRLDCLDELVSNEELFFGLTQGLRKFPKESDKVLCHFCFKPKKVTDEVLKPANGRKSQLLISDIIVLKTALDAIPFLSKVLKGANSFLLKNIYQTICENPKYESMRKRIGEVIDEDVIHSRAPFVACTQQCFAIKPGIDGLLDVARRSFCDTSEAIHNLATKYREEFTLPNLKIPYNNRLGFYFIIPLRDITEKLPNKFIQVVRHGKNVHCSSFELASVSLLLSKLIFLGFLGNWALTATLQSFDRAARRKDKQGSEFLWKSIVPKLTETGMIPTSNLPMDPGSATMEGDGPMAINAGRHPILESLHTDFVPNNIFLSEASNMVLVMGPNMSGKSTYLQQICLIVILAQVGCYVPAQFASLRVVDRIFTRIGTGDNVENNSSTFMTEMKETAFIMQNVSSRSLVVVDELGRATSSSDGLAIAWSCCEHLLSLKGYTVFATHMEGLSELATMYPNVKVLHFEVDLRNGLLDFKEMVRMDANCVQYQPLRMAYQAAQRLICLKYSNQGDDYIREALQDLKESYAAGNLI